MGIAIAKEIVSVITGDFIAGLYFSQNLKIMILLQFQASANLYLNDCGVTICDEFAVGLAIVIDIRPWSEP